MSTFFSYESPYRTGHFIELSMFEYIAPFVLLLGLFVLLLYVRQDLRSNLVKQRRLELVVGTIFTVLYLSHYILRFRLYGFDTIILPFQLCGISMFFAILLLFTNNKTIHAFVLYTGVAGGLISLFTPIIGYNSEYYRYYQFYFAHILLILTPLYFLLVKDYYPSKRSTVQALMVMQGLILFMGVFNYMYGTDYMFVFVDPTKLAKFPSIANFGGIPYYLIPGHLAVYVAFYLMYKGSTFLEQLHVRELQYKNT